MLNINHVSYSYGRRHPMVLEDFSLTLESGGVYGLLGPNGAGKSTLLSLIAGALTPKSGTVTLDGTDTRLRRPSTMADIFMVPEEISLPAMPLDKYLRLNGALYPRFSHDDMRRYLDLFGLDADVRLDRLSMGQKKKVFMCFAMSCNTGVLLMDEPTNGMDIPGKVCFRRFVAEAMTDDRIFIISTHQVRDVDSILDHILIINRRRVLLDRSVAEIQSALTFTETSDSALAGRALHSLPSAGGQSVILPNSGGDDTEINLELLFDFALNNPSSLDSIFNHKPQS